MNAKKWIKIFSIIPLLGIIIIGGINFLVDPLWTFKHSNIFNKVQLSFNERQQKTNNVYFNGLTEFDAILFGSSRTTFINQYDFQHMNVYNYAINSMYPFEYSEYLQLAKESKKEDFKYVIIGADFYNSKIRDIKRFENPSHYIANTKSTLYRYKMLLSIDVFKKSLKNIENSLYKKTSRYYTRDNVKFMRRISEKERVKRYTNNIKRHTEGFIGDRYKKNKEYINILQKLKKENPNSKFIIFTSPITANLLVSIIKNADKLEAFEEWLKDIIEVFGEVHHFMTINSVTKNLQNYPDDDHIYPNIGKLLANKLSFKSNEDIPDDFGIILNKSNINSYMETFKKQLQNYENPLVLEN